MSTPNCTLDVWQKKSYSTDGGHHQFQGPETTNDLTNNYWDGMSASSNNAMDNSISSIQTGSQTWVRLYTKSNCDGDFTLVGPNTSIPDLGTLSLDNAISSFRIYNVLPVDQGQVIQRFLNLYPGADKVSKSSGDCIEFYSQDSQYRIYYPSLSQSNNIVSFSMKLDHIKGGGKDDHATVTFAMDTQGYFYDKIQIDYDMNDSAYQVPNWVIKIVDAAIDVAEDEAIAFFDGAEIVLTAGVGAELVIPTDIAIEVGGQILTFGVNHINDVISKLFELAEDGGTMNFSTVPSHAIVRLLYAYLQEIYAANSGSLVTFSESSYASAFGKSWQTDKDTDYINFSNGGESYRSYCPDSSSGYSKMGLLASVKIDAINNNAKDDHMIMVATFDSSGKLFSVQASVDVYGAPDSGDKDDYAAPNSYTIAYNQSGQIVQITKNSVVALNGYSKIEDAWKDAMQASINNNSQLDHGDFSDSMKNIVNAGYQVLTNMKSSIKIK